MEVQFVAEMERHAGNRTTFPVLEMIQIAHFYDSQIYADPIFVSYSCSDKIRDLAGGVPLAIMKAVLEGGDAKAIEQAIIDSLNSVLGFVMPLCDTLNPPKKVILLSDM
jgi:hypothetical protein